MDNFTVGDRCLVHHLESDAGLPLNGQHVTLAVVVVIERKRERSLKQLVILFRFV